MARDRGVAIVTGASSGIGRATVVRLAAAGFHVLAGVRRESDGEAVAGAAAAGGRVEPLLVDITDAGAVAGAAQRATEAGDGRVAALVNNAGQALNGPVEALDADVWRRQYEVNLFGHVAMTRALLPALRAARGRIVNVGSIGGRMALPFSAPYTSSKFAVRGWSDAMRIELARHGVGVVLVEPGSIRTEIWRKIEEDADATEEQIPEALRSVYGPQVDKVRAAARRTARMSLAPERVARTIERALLSARPRARYLVGPDARIQAAIMRLPTPVVDRLVRLGSGA